MGIKITASEPVFRLRCSKEDDRIFPEGAVLITAAGLFLGALYIAVSVLQHRGGFYLSSEFF